MKDSDWTTLFHLMKQVTQLPGDWERQRQVVEKALTRLAGKKGKHVYDLFCALNIDGADEVLGDLEYEQLKEKREMSGQIIKMKQPVRGETNGHGGLSLLD